MESYEPDELEDQIDELRFSGKWERVITLLEKYVHVLDVGSAAGSRKHESVEEIKAYYWSVLSESLIAGKGTITKAIECAQKSIEVCPDYDDARILLCRILLSVCEPFLRCMDVADLDAGGFTINSKNVPTASTAFASDVPHFKASEVLMEAFSAQIPPALMTIPLSEQSLLLGVLELAPSPCSNILLAIIDALSIPDQAFICEHVLGFARCAPSKRPSHHVLFAKWVLVTARLLLNAVRVDEVIARLNDASVTSYRIWLHLDAVSCRSIISELLGEFLPARSDALLLAKHGAAYASLPLRCRCPVITALGSLPLLEATGGMLQDSLVSFDRCMTAPDSFALPIPVLLGLKVRIALQLIDRARSGASVRGWSGSPGSPHSASPFAAGSADVNKAMLMLSSVRTDLSTTISSQHASRLSLQPLEPLLTSLSWLLPRPPSDPRGVTIFSNSRTVSMTLAAIMLWQTPSSPPDAYDPHAMPFTIQIRRGAQASNSTAVAAVLEWGLHLDPSPSADFVYMFGRALLDAEFERVDKGRSLMQQSHRLCMQERELARALSVAGESASSATALQMVSRNVAPLLQWLGLYTPPSLHPWLPAAALADLAIKHADPLPALKALREHIVQIYGLAGEALLDLSGSDSAAKVMGTAAYFDPDAPDYSLEARYGLTNVVDWDENSHAWPASLSSLGFGSGNSGTDHHENKDKDNDDDDDDAQERGDRFELVGGSGSGGSSGSGVKEMCCEARGLLELTARLGQLHAAQARCGGEAALECRGHLVAALQCTDIVLRVAGAAGIAAGAGANAGNGNSGSGKGQSDAAIARLFVPEARLQRALLLAELGQTRPAIAAAQAATAAAALVGTGPGAGAGVGLGATSAKGSSSSTSSSSDTSLSNHFRARALHLQALVQASDADDDPTALGSAVALCQRAQELIVQGSLPHAAVAMSLGAMQWSAGDAENAMASAQMVFDHFRLTESGRSHDLLVQAGMEVEGASRDGNGDEAIVEGSYENRSTPSTPSAAAAASASASATATATATATSVALGQRLGTCLSRSARRRSTMLLVSASRLLRLGGELHDSSLCLQEAWRLLFTADDLTSRELAQEAVGEPEHRRREMLSHVPTMLGWRLPEASGWRAESLPECEAKVLVEAGWLALAWSAAGAAPREDAEARADKAFRLAIAICPRFCPALLAAAELELSRSSSNVGVGVNAAVRAGGASNGADAGASSTAEDTMSTYDFSVGPKKNEHGNLFAAILAARDAGAAVAQARAIEKCATYSMAAGTHASSSSSSTSLSRGENSLSVTLGEQGPASRSLELALLAVQSSELDEAAWGVYGKALQQNHLPKQAINALLVSLEVKQFGGCGFAGLPFHNVL